MTTSSIISLTDDNNINHVYRTTVIDSNNGATIIVDVVTNEDVDNTNNDHPMLDNSNNRQRIEEIDENNSNDCADDDNEQIIQLATTTTVLPQQKQQQQQQQQLPETPIPSPLLHLTTSTATTVADTAVQYDPLIAPVRVATTTTSNTDAISEHNAPMSLSSSSPPLDSSLSNQLVEKKKSIVAPIPPTTTKVNRQQQQQLPTFKDQLCASSSSSPIILNPSMVAVEVTQQPQEDEIEQGDRMNSVDVNHNNPVGRSSGGGVAIPMNGSGDSVIKERKLFPSSLDNNNIFNSGDDPTISTLTTNSTTFLPQHEQQSQQQQHRQQEEYWVSSQPNEVSIAEPPTIHAELVVESPVYPYPNNYNYFNNSSNNYTTTNTTSSSASSSQSVLPPLVYATPMLLSEQQQQQQGANSGNSDKNQPTQEHDAIPTKESITTTTSRKRRPYIILGIVLSVVLLIVGTVVVTVVMTTRIVSNEYHSQSSGTPNGSNNTNDGDDTGPTPSSHGSTTTSSTMPDIKGVFASWILVDGADQQLQQQPGRSSSKSSYSIDATTAYDPDAKLDPSSTFVLDPSVPVNTTALVSIDFSNDGLTMILANIQPCSNTNASTKTTTTTDCSTGMVTVYKYVHRQWLSVNTLNTSRTAKNTTTTTSDVVVAMDSSTSSTSNKIIFALGTVQKVQSKREMVIYRTIRVYQIQSQTDDKASNQYPGASNYFPDSREYEKVTTTQLGPDLPLVLSSSEEDSVAMKMDVTKGGRIVAVGVSSSFNTNATCSVQVYRLVQSYNSDNTLPDPKWSTMGQILRCGSSVMKYSAIQRIQLSNDGISLLVVTESSNAAMNTTTVNNYYHNRKKGGTSSITTVQTFRYVNDTWTPILPRNKRLGDMISSDGAVTPEAKATSLSDSVFDNTTENEHTDFGIVTAALSNDGKVLVQCSSTTGNGTQIIGICYTFRSYRRVDTTILEWKQFGSDIPIADSYQPLANTDITSVSLSDDGRTLVVAGLLSTPEEESDGYIWTVTYNQSDVWDVSDLNMIWTSRSNISVAFDDVAPIYVWLSDKGDKLLVHDENRLYDDLTNGNSIVMYYQGYFTMDGGDVQLSATFDTHDYPGEISWTLERLDVPCAETILMVPYQAMSSITADNSERGQVENVRIEEGGVYRFAINTWYDAYVQLTFNGRTISIGFGNNSNSDQFTFVVSKPDSNNDYGINDYYQLGNSSSGNQISNNITNHDRDVDGSGKGNVAGTAFVTLVINFDAYPSDIHWVLLNTHPERASTATSTSILAFGPEKVYSDSLAWQQHIEVIDVSAVGYHDTVTLILTDDGYDGLCCNSGYGKVTIYNGTVLGGFNKFTDSILLSNTTTGTNGMKRFIQSFSVYN